MAELSLISAEVVLLSPEEGGRQNPVLACAYGGGYRPHIVLEKRENRSAKIEVKNGSRTITDKYLGVVFWKGPDPVPVDLPFTITLVLMYAAEIYSEVEEGVTFTLREGACIIGHGVVRKRWQEEVSFQTPSS